MVKRKGKPDACAVNYNAPGKYPTYSSPAQDKLRSDAYTLLNELGNATIEGRYKDAEIRGYRLAGLALDIVLQARREQGLGSTIRADE